MSVGCLTSLVGDLYCIVVTFVLVIWGDLWCFELVCLILTFWVFDLVLVVGLFEMLLVLSLRCCVFCLFGYCGFVVMFVMFVFVML